MILSTLVLLNKNQTRWRGEAPASTGGGGCHALYFKGIIEERFEESRISKDDYGNRIFSSFYYLVENK